MPDVINLEIFESKEHKPVTDEPEPVKATATAPKQDEGEATGHSWFARYVRCCFCGAVNYIKYSDTYVNTYICHCCGGYFDV